MQKIYKIKSIYPSMDRMKTLISDIVYIDTLKIGQSAILVYLDIDREPSFGKCMITSTVGAFYEQLCIKGFASEIIIQTINNTYRLEELNSHRLKKV